MKLRYWQCAPHGLRGSREETQGCWCFQVGERKKSQPTGGGASQIKSVFPEDLGSSEGATGFGHIGVIGNLDQDSWHE